MTKFIIYVNSIILMIATFFGSSFVPRGLQLDADKLEKTVTASNEARIEAGTITGAHVFIKQSGKTVLDKTYGLDGVGGTALKNNAVYRIASMTKPITALALLIEHDRGHLSIYDDVSKYIPEFAEMYVAKKDKDGNNIIGADGLKVAGKKATKSLKLYQLVSHTSGVGEVTPSAVGNPCTTRTAAMWLATQPLDFNPGTAQQYSTGAFDVAAAVVEITSGMEFSEYIKVNIFDKLGMTDTTFEPTQEQWSRFVQMHNFADGKVFNVPMNENCVFGDFNVSYHVAGGGLASTTYDYMKFAEMFLNEGKAADGTEVISAKSLKLFSTPVKDGKRNGDERWGLGVRVVTKTGNVLPVGSFGWSGAYGSHFWIDPTNKICTVYMKNTVYDGGAGSKSARELKEDVMNSFKLLLVEK